MTYEYKDEDYPVNWTGDDGTHHVMTTEGAAEVLKKFFDDFPGGLGEYEAAMRTFQMHLDFFQQVAELTKEHDVLTDASGGDHAVVYPSKLGEALSHVDPNWHGWDEEL